jgi:hypothetical protein
LYHIHVATDQAFTNLVRNIARTTSSASVGVLNQNTLYFWRVNAANDNGTSAWSNVWRFTTGTNAPPPDPCMNQESASFNSLDAFVVSDARGYKQGMYVHRHSRPLAQEAQKFDIVPPQPPSGVFHAGFVSGRYIENIADRKAQQHIPIKVDNTRFPLKLQWRLHPEQNYIKYGLKLPPGKNGTQGKTIILGDTGTVAIASGDPGNRDVVLSLDAQPDQTMPPPCGEMSKAGRRQGGDDAVNQQSIPPVFALHQNYPNPFNPTSLICYDLPDDGKVTLRVYNVLGQVVKTLIDEEQPAGYKQVAFDMSAMGSGIYFYKITAGKYSEMKKMALVR